MSGAERPPQRPSGGWEIPPAEVKRLLDDRAAGRGAPFTLVDCRREEEVLLARIEGSVHIPLEDLDRRHQELDDRGEGPIVVYCHHGVRSLKAAALLRARGIPGVMSMAGGLERWSREIDPTVPRY